MKMCPACTTNNVDDALQCERCGYVFPAPKRTYNYPKDIITHTKDHPPSARAKIAMILAVAGMASVFFLVFCAPIPGILAILFGNQELKALKKAPYSSKGETYANIGVWGGWISTTIGLLMIGLGTTVTLWFYNWFKETFIY